MFGSLAKKFARIAAISKRTPRWERRKGDYLVKTARFTDGEILHLLVGKSPDKESSDDTQFYKSLQEIRAHTLKSTVWMIGSGAFGILAHFHGLKSASSSGLEISSAVFYHAAILALSFSFAWFCFNFSKQNYVQSWFLAKLRNSSANQKAILLLKYPDAFFHFNFMPGAIGYPIHIHSKRRGYTQLLSIILILIILIFFSLGSWALWITIALDVWKSNDIGRYGTIITLVLSSSLVLLGLSSPFRYDFRKEYRHFGLVNQLVKLQGADLNRAHMRIWAAAKRMDLVENTRK